MQDKPKPDETEEKPKAVKDSLEEALESVDRTFDGEQKGEEEGADEDSAMSGHPATESEGAEAEAKAEPAPEKEGEEALEEKPKVTPKYKSHEEAEAAATEGQRQITKLSMEVQELKDLLLKTVAGSKGVEPEGDKTPAGETVAVFSKRRRREALDEIEGLDPDDENHKDKIAEIQARADEDILKRYQEESSTLEAQKKKENEGVQATINQAKKAMKDAGLNPEQDSPDSVLFWGLSQLVPKQKDGLPLSLDEQIAWCVNEVAKYKNESLDSYKTSEAKRLASERQDENEPLGRGAGGPPPKSGGRDEATKPVTLGSVVEDVMQSRRI